MHILVFLFFHYLYLHVTKINYFTMILLCMIEDNLWRPYRDVYSYWMSSRPSRPFGTDVIISKVFNVHWKLVGGMDILQQWVLEFACTCPHTRGTCIIICLHTSYVQQLQLRRIWFKMITILEQEYNIIAVWVVWIRNKVPILKAGIIKKTALSNSWFE